MKRSEMVDIMCEEFDRYVGDDYLESVNFLDAFDFVLRRMEKEGMTPPRYTVLMRNGEKYDKDKHFGADVIDRVGWEPEDE